MPACAGMTKGELVLGRRNWIASQGLAMTGGPGGGERHRSSFKKVFGSFFKKNGLLSEQSRGGAG
jgi:hypothetical protein